MSRQLKFRVWDKDDIGWIDQSHLRVNADGYLYLPYGIAPQRNVERFIIQQFTGFIDKNGKEIYEGDIVRYSFGAGDSESLQIVWDNFYGGGFAFAGPDGKGLNHTGIKFTNNIWHGNDNYEVIGNIFEDSEILYPELLS